MTLSGGNDTVPGGKCVQYQLVSTDNAGLVTTTGPTGIVKVKQNPVVTWNPPATMLFGTTLSSTQLNATANVAGTFQYTPPAGTLLQPGMQQLSVTFTPTNTADYNASTTLRVITVGFSQACLTGSLSGSLTIKSGNAYCIQGGKVSGSITVQSGGSLYISGGAISGSITSTGATALTLCGTSVSGSTSISSSSGLVELGGPSGSGCAANKFSSAVTLSGNNAGVIAVGNTISGAVTASSNKGGVLFSGNKVSGSDHHERQQRRRHVHEQHRQRQRDDHEQHRRLHVLRQHGLGDRDAEEQHLGQRHVRERDDAEAFHDRLRLG